METPVSATYKTNYDGAVFTESGEAGIGVEVRDARGEVIAALSEKITYPGSVELLEELIVRRAANFTIELGLSSSEFEGDSEVVCGALKVAEWGHPSLSQIVKDTSFIIGSLRTFSFTHTKQRGNCIIHTLAKKAIVSFPLLLQMKYVPSYIHQLVILDPPAS